LGAAARARDRRRESVCGNLECSQDCLYTVAWGDRPVRSNPDGGQGSVKVRKESHAKRIRLTVGAVSPPRAFPYECGMSASWYSARWVTEPTVGRMSFG